MKASSFFHRHYLVAGESFTTHAAAVLTGGVMMIVGLALATTVTFLPVGLVVGLLGLFIFGGGIFAHIQSPVKFRDLLDSTIALAGAAIGMTFTLAVLLFLVAISVSVIVLMVGWLRSVL
jgi:hypothetical protein